jgi:plastocyanin
MWNRLFFVCLALTMLFAFSVAPESPKQPKLVRQVIVPEADRFAPFALTIHVGDSVQWVNNDEDDHTIVAVGPLTTSDHNTVNHLLKGLENNGNQPGRFTLKFNQAGRFLYYCRFHAHIDGSHQPVAPGPKGGVEDSKGNFGVPMMGVITVLATP